MKTSTQLVHEAMKTLKDWPMPKQVSVFVYGRTDHRLSKRLWFSKFSNDLFLDTQSPEMIVPTMFDLSLTACVKEMHFDTMGDLQVRIVPFEDGQTNIDEWMMQFMVDVANRADLKFYRKLSWIERTVKWILGKLP